MLIQRSRTKDKIDIPVVNVIGTGDQDPVASNLNVEGRSLNRRAEFQLIGTGVRTVVQNIASAEVLNTESMVRLAFKSAGTKGRTGINRLPLNQLVGGYDAIETRIQGRAIGSWDMVTQTADVVSRDPNVQGLISVVDGTRLANPAIAVKFDLDSRLTPKLSVDGVEVPRDRIGFSMADTKTGKTIYSYIGVRFGEPGEHEFVLQGFDRFGNTR